MSADDLHIGQLVLGRYRIVRCVARGGMGLIYLARTEGSAGFVKPVIVKRIVPGLMLDESSTRMFVREALIMSNLRHPGIVSIVDFREEDGSYFMVLEYVKGYNLSSWLRFLKSKRESFPAGLAIHIVICVLDALHYAHTLTDADGSALKIIHRDVTPSNVLIDVDGHVKLSDFGIARMEAMAAELRTTQLTIKGKYSYLAPEILSAGEPSVLSDVYSCGVVLRELLTGKNEFRGETVEITTSRIASLELKPLTAYRSDLSPGLLEIDRRAMARAPSERFQSAAAFAQALRELRTQSLEDASAELAGAAKRDFYDERLARLTGGVELGELERSWREPTYDSGVEPMSSGAPTIADGKTLTAKTRTPSVEALHVPKGKWTWILALGAVCASAAGVLLVHQIGKAGDVERPPQLVLVDGDVSPIDLTEAAPSSDPAPPPKTEVPATPKRPQKRDPSDANMYSRAFAKQRARIQRCITEHADEISGEPSLAVRIQIDEHGRVSDAEMVPEQVARTRFSECITSVAKETSFGPQASPVTVRIPVIVRRSK
jgi:serine/threonine-protein kinase